MIILKSVTDFKRHIKVGVKLHTIYHKVFGGRDEKGNVIFKTEDKGIREVSIVQSNKFALKTKRKDNDEFRDSWCEFPRAKEAKIDGNKITIFEEDNLPVLTYTIIE